MPLGGLSVIAILGVEVPQNGYQPGYVLHSLALPPDAKSDGQGFYLLANKLAADGYRVLPDYLLRTPEDRLTNEPQTFALVRSSEAPRKGTTISRDTRFPSGLYDAVAINDARGDSIFFFGAPVVGPDRQYLAAGATRLRDGVNTGDKSDWVLADIELPPSCYNTPKAPNRPGSQVVVADARTPVPSGTGVTSTPSPTPAPKSDQGVQWRHFDPIMVEAAIDQEGTALVYARSETFAGCAEFERAYLLAPGAQPLLANRPTFFLNVNIPGNGRLASDMGIYKVPTLAFRRKGGRWEYLVIDGEATPQMIYQFLNQR
jgi:hypothetical protein